MTAPPNLLSIAGSDPSGGAGIQADLKTFAANGAYGMAVLTALTAQNTRGVSGAHLVPPAFVDQQIRAVYQDVQVDAVKIGMIATAEIALAVAEALKAVGARRVVLDPVMVATSGDRLLDENAVAVVRDRLLPMADLVTPNLPEAAALADRPEPHDRSDMPALAEALRARGATAVLLKGGHLSGDESPDLLLSEAGPVWLEGARRRGRAIHGGGCTLSSAIAAQWARLDDLPAAARAAKAYVAGAIAGAARLEVGSGACPLDHFFEEGAR
ncbi:MAG: bifunctional hydroxymethylpyrimidine kinase/phosphomethylpyrimidine kinase [Pseudomonadota bacterium]